MKRYTSILLVFFSFLFLNAQLQLPSILSDNMVLQQNSTVNLWGKATPGSSIRITPNWDKKTYVTKVQADSVWEVKINTIGAGGPYNILIVNNKDKKVLRDIFLGEVWLCSGQSNMEMTMKGFNSQPVNGAREAILESEKFNHIRIFSAERTVSTHKNFDLEGDWNIASIRTTADFSAIGYLYACELHKVLNVPIGIVHISWGGSNIQAWMSQESLKMFSSIDLSKIDLKADIPQQVPTLLYNGMFYPISKYAVKGIVWYQGESNIEDPKLYSKMFPAMVSEWRKNIGLGDIPFNFVQIAPYFYLNSNETEGALIREVQLKSVQEIPNSCMAVTMDIGEEYNIHPAEKGLVSKRLADIALATVYGFDTLPFSSPVYKSKEIANEHIILTFENAEEGLIPFNGPLNGFEIAGSDKVFYPAEARVVNVKHVDVWSDQVAKPQEVRYCFKNFVIGNLKSTTGFPVSSFRTDE